MRLLRALLAATVFWVGAHQLRGQAVAERVRWPRAVATVLIPPAQVLQFAPNRELVADLLWCRLLVYYGSNWLGDGDLSQVEQLLDGVITLSPRFKAVYEWAAYAVTYRTGTATQEEFRSSIRYLEKAMREFPDDYQYFWIAGARYYFDLWSPDAAIVRKYRERGAELIEHAMAKPNAPHDLATTAANMRSKLGQQQRALENLRQMVLSTNDQDARQTMLSRVRVADPDLADALERAALELQESWLRTLPMVPIDFFVVLGERPSPVIDLRKLATPQDLFGAAPVDDSN